MLPRVTGKATRWGSFAAVTAAIHQALGKLSFKTSGTFAGSISTGQQWMLNANDVAPAAGPAVTISKNVAQLKDPSQGGSSKTNVALHLGTADASQGFVVLDNYGNSSGPSMLFRSGRGTAASPTATQTNDFLFNFYAAGWGSTVQAGFGAYMGAFALESWTDSAQGSAWVYYTNAIGSTSITERVRIGQGLGVGVTTEPGVGSIAGAGGLQTAAPSTKTGNYTVLVTDSSLILNGSGTITLTLLAAATYPGRELVLKNIAAFTVVSASSNVVPQAGGAAGTAILAATAGKWAVLKSDGTNWQIMTSN